MINSINTVKRYSPFTDCGYAGMWDLDENRGAYELESADFVTHADYAALEAQSAAQAARIEQLESEIERLVMLPLTDELKSILGRMCFECAGLADELRGCGWEIKSKAEDEQATVIHFLLTHYLKSGAGWVKSASEELRAIKASEVQS